jgi:hypothetical protein
MRVRAPHSWLIALASTLFGLLAALPASAQFTPPTAVPDNYATSEGLTLEATPGVRANDEGFLVDQYQVDLVSLPTNGTVTLTNADGSFTYVPNANFSGTDTFLYQLSGLFGTSNAAVVTIVVNAAPDGVVNRSYPATENTALSIAAPGVLTEVTDVEGNAISAQVVTTVSSGSLNLDPNGAFTFTPAAGFSGVVTFTYRAVDSAGAQSAPATVTINVANVNDPPVANANTYAATEDTTLTVNISEGVLSNDTDPDPDTTLNAVLVSTVPPAAGNLALNPNGSFTYTPTLNFSGSASFTYRARDNGSPVLTSAPATVTINVAAVNDAPVANADAFDANVGIPLTVDPPGVLANDTDVEGNAVTAQLVSSVAAPTGTLTLAPTGGFTYTPAAGFTGAATFTYRARDNGSPAAQSAPATATITVRNAPPRFAQGVTVVPDQTATENVAFTTDLAPFFVDPEGAPLTFAMTGLPPGLSAATNGTISGTPTITAGIGTFTVNVIVSDGPNTFPTTFTMRVLSAGRTDLALTATATPSPALVNEQIAWTFKVENRSTVENVRAISLEAVFAAPAALPITAPANCTVTPQADRTTLACTAGPVAAGGQITVTATGGSSLPGDILVIANVRITDPTPIDSTPDNDAATVAVNIAETAASGPAQTLAVASVLASASGDLNGDGFVDLAVATNSGGGAAIYPNVPDPRAPSGAKRALATQAVPLETQGPSTGIAIADVDGDRALDLIVAKASGPSLVLRNRGDGSFTFVATAVPLGAAQDASKAVAARDLDGDGRIDVVLANSGPNRVFMNQGGGVFTETPALGDDDTRDVVLANLAGDARLELVFANANGNATVYSLGNSAATPIPTGPTTSVAAGDLNGDGRADLVFGSARSKLVFFNAGSGLQFVSPPLQLGAAPTADVLIEDIDADGDLDIVAVNASGGHQVYANDGAGRFTLRPQTFSSTGARHAALGKMSADDRIDVVVSGDSSLDVFYNDGAGNFGKGDTGAPIIQLLGAASVDLTVEAAYTDAGASALDAVDGDVTAKITVTNPLNTAVVGTYTITYNAVDSSGNAATPVTRTVNVGVRTGTGGGGGGALDFATLLALAILLLGVMRPRLTRRSVS